MTPTGRTGQSTMIGRFNYELEHTHPVAVLRAHGVLDADTAVDFRVAMMELLTEQPPGLVIDVADLAVTDDIALTVLVAVARDSERWPGTRLAVGGAAADFAESANRMGVTRNMVVCPDYRGAEMELNRLPVPPRRYVRLEPDRFAPGLAREAVHEFCQNHRVRRGADAAQLIASELVTNAVVHAGTPIGMTLRLMAPDLHIAVRDRADGAVRITGDGDPGSVHTGRGLMLVEALASRWGSFHPNNGKVVWATVRIRTTSKSSEVGPDLP
jgi:anti-anti-sigma regulatory factor/anti-sigma regulatory factor (Ser/Thr protein kinase)